jgi:hypothetical protein
MIERFFRTKDTLQVIGKNELSRLEYFEKLSEFDTRHINYWLQYIENLNNEHGFPLFSVIATGSIVKPPEKRDHEPEDIDIRILNSRKSNTRERKSTLWDLQKSFCDQLDGLSYQQVLDYEIKKPEPSYSASESPSFKITYRDGGLPIHISYPGASVYEAKKYISIERNNDEYFAVLFDPSNKI